MMHGLGGGLGWSECAPSSAGDGTNFPMPTKGFLTCTFLSVTRDVRAPGHQGTPAGGREVRWPNVVWTPANSGWQAARKPHSTNDIPSSLSGKGRAACDGQ